MKGSNFPPPHAYLSELKVVFLLKSSVQMEKKKTKTTMRLYSLSHSESQNLDYPVPSLVKV